MDQSPVILSVSDFPRKSPFFKAGAVPLGRALEYMVEADPSDFVFVPPHVPHQEINALPEFI